MGRRWTAMKITTSIATKRQNNKLEASESLHQVPRIGIANDVCVCVCSLSFFHSVIHSIKIDSSVTDSYCVVLLAILFAFVNLEVMTIGWQNTRMWVTANKLAYSSYYVYCWIHQISFDVRIFFLLERFFRVRFVSISPNISFIYHSSHFTVNNVERGKKSGSMERKEKRINQLTLFYKPTHLSTVYFWTHIRSIYLFFCVHSLCVTSRSIVLAANFRNPYKFMHIFLGIYFELRALWGLGFVEIVWHRIRSMTIMLKLTIISNKKL